MNLNREDKSALNKLRVIDLTHYVAGPYCTKLLAGFGAEVIKIERPKNGDPLRQQAPYYQQKEDIEQSIPFLWLNTGKKSITLNLKTTEGITLLKTLVKSADVLVENFSPRVLPSLGLGYDVLKTINPHLIMASISNFGQTGPYRDFLADEIVIAALSGQMDNTGAPDGPPLASGPALNQYTAGMHAYIAILMALCKRGAKGKGQHLDISIMESAIEQIENRVNNTLRTGKITRRGSHPFAPWGLYPCNDGYATIIGAPFRNWTKGVNLFNEPKLADAKYRHARDRIKHRQEIDALIGPKIQEFDKKTIFHMGQKQGLSFGYLTNTEEALNLPSHKTRNFFSAVDHPNTGPQLYADAPFKMSESEWKTSRAPLLGEHNHDVFCNLLGIDSNKVTELSHRGVI